MCKLSSSCFAVYVQVLDAANDLSYFPPVVQAMPPRIPIRLQHLCYKRRHVHHQLQQEEKEEHQAQEVGASLLTRDGSFHLPPIPPPTAVLQPFTTNRVKDAPRLIPLI